MAYIALKDVKKVYKTGEIEIHAADGITFEMEKGEFVVIVGPSGAGKTTVLNILGGMDSATSGIVLVDGEDVAGYNQKRLTKYRREDVGFVFQFYNLVQNLTALENVELAQQIIKNPKNASEALEEVGLKERMKKFPAQLSGGEQQRVSIARALAKRSDIYIFDEPFANLDKETSLLCVDAIKKEAEGALIIAVLHDTELAESISERVICL